MAYQVLARKYRPQRFADVAGQDHVTRTLTNALTQGRIAHGYIFSGHRGIGKTTIARILAMALNCRQAIGSAERPTPEPCSTCESCTEVRAGNSVDVIEIDAATHRGIDEIRELRDAARYRPARDRYKIYILDEAHQITDAAFNALLKTLEEPPDHVVFMMATTQPEDIPQTIRSRCQHFSFHAVKFEAILEQLRGIAAEEEVAADEEALALLAEAGDGSMRDALSIMDQAIASAPPAGTGTGERPILDAARVRELMGSVPNTVFERLLEAISENQSAPVIEEIDRLLNVGNSASQLARQFVRYLRNVLMARIAGEATELLQLSPDERSRAARSALLFSEEDLTRFLQVMLRTFDDLNYRQEPRFHLELGLLKLVHLQRLLPVEQLLSQIGGGSGTLPPTRLVGGPLGGQPARAVRTATLPAQAGSVEPRPAFSPFESDARRKNPSGLRATSPPQPPAPAQATAPALPQPVEEERPTKATTRPEVTAMAGPAEPGPTAAPDRARIEDAAESVPVSARNGPAQTGPAQELKETMKPAPADLRLDEVRAAVVAALEQAGHNTAAALLGNGIWTTEGETIQVEVAAKKTMLGLTMNAAAEKVSREALRCLGANSHGATLVWVPGETLRTGVAPAKLPPAPSGSVQARALEHPLVKQAQELFRAEVRSVVDLRNK